MGTNARGGGGPTAGGCEVAWVRQVRETRRELRLAALALGALVLAAAGLAAAIGTVASAPDWRIYAAR